MLDIKGAKRPIIETSIIKRLRQSIDQFGYNRPTVNLSQTIDDFQQ